jgi:hypothetical protein
MNAPTLQLCRESIERKLRDTQELAQRYASLLQGALDHQRDLQAMMEKLNAPTTPFTSMMEKFDARE